MDELHSIAVATRHPPRRSQRASLLVRVHAALLMLLSWPSVTTAADAAQPTPTAAGSAKTALVFGGSGQLGSEVVRELVSAGYSVSVFLRPSSSRARLQGMAVEPIEGNVLADADVERALKSRRFSVVVDALGRSESDVTFFATSGRNIARWSAASGVEHIILHSSVGVGRSRAAYPQERLGAMARLFEAKGAGEQAFIDSGVRWTIIRNAVLRDLPPGQADAAKLIADETSFGAVSRRGLARLTRECALNPGCQGKIYHGIDAGMKY
jgi:uncharacterized protein YbjT (DUF2867 family)